MRHPLPPPHLNDAHGEWADVEDLLVAVVERADPKVVPEKREADAESLVHMLISVAFRGETLRFSEKCC